MIKTIFIQSALFIFSFIIPKQKNLILLGSGAKNDFRGNPKFLFLYLKLNNLNYEYYWSTASKKIFKELHEQGLPVLYRNSLKGVWKILRAEFLIIEKSAKDVYYTDYIFGRFNFLQTWHGIVFKRTGLEALEDKKGNAGKSILSNTKLRKFMTKHNLLSMMKFRLILSTSYEFEELLKRSFINNNVVTLGYPRNDVFFNKKLQYTDYIKILNLEKFDKIIVYAPTHREGQKRLDILTDSFFNQVEKILTELNAVLLIKKHPLLESVAVPSKYNHIKDVSKDVFDIQDLLVHTDLLISDYSSVVHDFILTGKPIIYFIYDLNEYESSCAGFYYDYRSTLSGPFAENEDELLNLIATTDNWRNKENYKKRYTKQQNKFHTNKDGNSCKRFFNYLNTDLLNRL